MSRSPAEEASIACSEALERLVRGELYFAGRWAMLAQVSADKVADVTVRQQLDELRERIESLATRCQRASATRRCAECDRALRFGDHSMCPGCRITIVERVLSSELWRAARPSSVVELQRFHDRLVKVQAKRK